MGCTALASWRQWKKRHPDYPLTVHPAGQWSKKIRGRVHYFGPLADPDGALQLWLQEKDYLLAGIQPPTYESGLTVKGLLDKHLADADERICAGKLAPRTRRDYVNVRRFFRQSMLMDLPVRILGPEHFARLQRCMEEGYSLRSQKNFIVAIKTILNWGRKMELFDCEIRYGPRFVAPSLNSIEAEQEENGNCRFLDRKWILAALAAARPKLKVAIFLGINCGFYPGDTIAITLDHLHMDGEIPYHDFRRVKTKQRRMAALWPETVAAIQDYQNSHRKPADPSERRLLLAQAGYGYGINGGAKLAASFARILPNRPQRAGLGSLRHTYGTVVDLVPDQAMIDLTMGHISKSLQKRVYSQLDLRQLERLRTLSWRVREWLFREYA